MGTAYYLSVLATAFLTSLQCDEAKPVCSGCNRHQVTCIYDHPAKLSDKIKAEDSETSSTAASSSTAKGTDPNTDESTQRRLLERMYS
jgi:hypothetical protein